MQVDSQQEPHTTAPNREQDVHSMQASDLTRKEGVGRCYYTPTAQTCQSEQSIQLHGSTPPCAWFFNVTWYIVFAQFLLQIRLDRHGHYLAVYVLYVEVYILYTWPSPVPPSSLQTLASSRPQIAISTSRLAADSGFNDFHVKADGVPTGVCVGLSSATELPPVPLESLGCLCRWQACRPSSSQL